MTLSLLARDASPVDALPGSTPPNDDNVWLRARERLVARLRANDVIEIHTSAPLTPALLSARVQAGVEFLDERLGRDVWLSRVNLATLDVSSGLDCVVCQVTGVDFVTGMALLGFHHSRNVVSTQLGTRYGFTASSSRAYVALTAEWKNRVTQLRVEQSRNERVEVSA
jgi:hypothetical protein